eukprot:CAMPEP_0113440922 /NCGR_PEP_ID=MMETSP0014_2-20120614/810_1 /TAXON_ID=2857 /ORGANISM="Nitzschia sp." /LENGTH=878 /DNA_ID=CAMNT_0000331737 /DNA_START=104 /DNA_END=2740 /DNA_ORIENTATION=+ /assembly_acc=CAM_ASM_000159
MPSLVLFGRRTCFAGDDLRFFIVAQATYRIFQLCVTISLSSFVYTKFRQEDENPIDIVTESCDGYGRFPSLTSNGMLIFHFYMVNSFLLCGSSLAVLWPMYYVSGLGTPTQVEPRRPLFSICYCDLIWVNFLRVAACTVGGLVVYIYSAYCSCISRTEDILIEFDLVGTPVCPAGDPIVLLLTILFASQCIDAGYVVFVGLCFVYGSLRAPITFISSEQKCRLCCRCFVGCASIFTCCLFGGGDALFGDFADFSRIFANFLQDNKILDLTPSDVLVGLHMVRRQENDRKLKTQRLLQKEHTNEMEANRTINPKSHKVLMTGRFLSGRMKSDVIPITGDEDNIETSSVSRTGSDVVRGVDDDFQSQDHDEDFNRMADDDIEFQFEPQSTSSHLNFKTGPQILSRYQQDDVYLIAEAAHFMPIAQSAYTWISYMLEHPVSGWCMLPYLILRRCTCLFPGRDKDKINGDYPWQLHTAALKAISGCRGSDLVYASYYDSAEKLPYCILLDHDWKTVVVAIRGTLTLEGVFKDISINPKELTEAGEVCGFDGRGLFCHTGMLRSSEWLLADLNRHGRLDKLLTGDYKDYKLRIIGHSLGAGVASILSVLLRPEYPTLRCLAFSPPGCVMSKDLADASMEWTTSFVVGDDIVPRMSIEGFEELRDCVLDMICRIKIPKYQVTRAQQELQDDKVTTEKKAKAKTSLRSILYEHDEVEDSKFRQQVLEFWKFQDDMKQQNSSHYIELCPPGEIIELFKHRHGTNVVSRSFVKGIGSSIVGEMSTHSSDIRPTGVGGDNNIKEREYDDDDEDDNDDWEDGKRPFTARRAHRSEFRRVIVSPHLLADHDPIGVKRRLQDIAKNQFGVNPPFSEKDLREKTKNESAVTY